VRLLHRRHDTAFYMFTALTSSPEGPVPSTKRCRLESQAAGRSGRGMQWRKKARKGMAQPRQPFTHEIGLQMAAPACGLAGAFRG